MPSHLKLNERVGSNNSVDLRDIVPVKRALKTLGYYDTPSYGMTPYPDSRLFDGARALQAANNLTVDGVMMPGGETERTINRLIAEKQEKNPRIDPDMPIIRPGRRMSDEEREEKISDLRDQMERNNKLLNNVYIKIEKSSPGKHRDDLLKQSKTIIERQKERKIQLDVLIRGRTVS